MASSCSPWRTRVLSGWMSGLPYKAYARDDLGCADVATAPAPKRIFGPPGPFFPRKSMKLMIIAVCISWRSGTLKFLRPGTAL